MDLGGNEAGGSQNVWDFPVYGLAPVWFKTVSTHVRGLGVMLTLIRTLGRVLRTINARHEVIVSAGSIGTPQLLLNSGIGDATELKRLGIPAFHNLPDVGKYFRDHASMTFPYARTAQGALPPLDRAAALQQWQTSKTGPFSDRGIGSHQLLFARIAANSSVWKNHNDPAAGPNVPHMELLPVNADVPGGFNICGALLVIAQPFSSTQTPFVQGEDPFSTFAHVNILGGTVGVRSSNPFDDPLVNPAYLAEQVDLDLYAEAIRLSKKFFTGPNWSTILGAPQYPDPDILSRADWEDAMRNEVSSGIHGVGGAIMSPRGSDYGVVDPDLKVKGLRGLRVVDASVMPHIPDGHTAVPTYIIAERASDLILQDWSLPV
ncbi:FAD/NAD(P)-binding domain-containing protein [Coprinopsis marcescibilis]|uniref:pyranose dehydrogenase (acceptor) n=1 Tax=Coprinopsis marcescibilis TaxID=230819 RepID=A0A5C3KMY2_COPMA|nr:FAD/NAD(P)-binding domain-containing protein [Coprinopsis marcescibilis]